MTDRTVYQIKVKDQLVVAMIGLVIAAVSAVAVFFPDTFDPGTAIARTAQRLAPLLLVVGVVTAAKPILAVLRRHISVDDAGIVSPLYWTLDRGTVEWSDVEAIEPVGAPYGSKRGLRITVKQGKGIIVPLDVVAGGERLEEDLYRRLRRQQALDSIDE